MKIMRTKNKKLFLITLNTLMRSNENWGIKKTIKVHYEQIYVNKFENLSKIYISKKRKLTKSGRKIN